MSPLKDTILLPILLLPRKLLPLVISPHLCILLDPWLPMFQVINKCNIPVVHTCQYPLVTTMHTPNRLMALLSMRTLVIVKESQVKLETRIPNLVLCQG